MKVTSSGLLWAGNSENAQAFYSASKKAAQCAVTADYQTGLWTALRKMTGV
jgi:hypothetical protein